MIIAGPGVARRGQISHAYTTVMDLAPTFLDLAGARYPSDGSVQPMEGESIVPLLAVRSSTVHDDNYVTTLFHNGWALVRRGRWKLSTLDPPFQETAFELFDIVTDPGETTNLADTQPDIYREMLELWRAERARLGITLPSEMLP